KNAAGNAPDQGFLAPEGRQLVARGVSPWTTTRQECSPGGAAVPGVALRCTPGYQLPPLRGWTMGWHSDPLLKLPSPRHLAHRLADAQPQGQLAELAGVGRVTVVQVGVFREQPQLRAPRHP